MCGLFLNVNDNVCTWIDHTIRATLLKNQWWSERKSYPNPEDQAFCRLSFCFKPQVLHDVFSSQLYKWRQIAKYGQGDLPWHLRPLTTTGEGSVSDHKTNQGFWVTWFTPLHSRTKYQRDRKIKRTHLGIVLWKSFRLLEGWGPTWIHFRRWGDLIYIEHLAEEWRYRLEHAVRIARPTWGAGQRERGGVFLFFCLVFFGRSSRRQTAFSATRHTFCAPLW